MNCLKIYKTDYIIKTVIVNTEKKKKWIKIQKCWN